MKLPVEWLRESVQTPLTDEELADALTMAGLEVEETTASEGGGGDGCAPTSRPAATAG